MSSASSNTSNTLPAPIPGTDQNLIIDSEEMDDHLAPYLLDEHDLEQYKLVREARKRFPTVHNFEFYSLYPDTVPTHPTQFDNHFPDLEELLQYSRAIGVLPEVGSSSFFSSSQVRAQAQSPAHPSSELASSSSSINPGQPLLKNGIDEEQSEQNFSALPKEINWDSLTYGECCDKLLELVDPMNTTGLVKSSSVDDL